MACESHPRDLECHVFVIGGPQQVQPPVVPLGEVVPPGQQGPPVLVQRIILASTPPRGLTLEPLPAAGELVRCQMHDVERIHHLPRLGQYLVDGGGVAGEAVHGHHLHLAAQTRVAFLQPRAQHVRAAAWADIQ